jgi:hypothetical protein
MTGGSCAVAPLSFDILSSFSCHPSSEENSSMNIKGMEETMEHLQILLRQEKEAYAPCMNYLSSASLLTGGDTSEVVSEAWRRKLCEWCFEVVDHFGFDREAVAIALNYLDRSVAARSTSSGEPICKREFQLLAVTSLYMALKIHGETEDLVGPRRKVRIDAFVELSRGFFQVDVIEATESRILSTLNWRMNPPTCLRFVAAYLRLCPQWSENGHHQAHTSFMGGIYDIARYLTELSVCVSTFSFTWKTSAIAYASILCGMEALQSSFPIPYAARVVLQNNIAEATGLLPNDPEILSVRELMKDLCPNMFKGIEVPFELMGLHGSSSKLSEDPPQESGKTSPVCVVDEQSESGRKRSRPSSHDASSRPLHRSSF